MARIEKKRRKARRREECETAISEECSWALCMHPVHQLQFEILTLLANRETFIYKT